ncbi:MAG: hypothetical protein ACRENO_07130 [Thermodesulfobacteriota bacterium]
MNNIQNRLPENLKQFTDKNQPIEKRMMAAAGMIPLSPPDLAKILTVFLYDENNEIKLEAKKSLNDIPEDQMLGILSDKETFPELLDYAAKNFKREIFSQTILLNRTTWDGTVAYLAENDTSHANLEIIANNKQRILRSVEIIEALSKNSLLSRSIMDEVLSFLSLHLQKSDELKKFMGVAEPTKDEPGDLSLEEITSSFFDDADVSDDLVEESKEANIEVDIVSESILQKIQRLSMAQKIKVALQGNTESRRILIKDPNKVISSAVLRNPKISETEIVLISQSKIVSDDILRQISDNKKWTKFYQVKLSLVKNPKTPSHISLNYLRHLRELDIKSIMKDKNLPGVVTNGANNIYKDMRRGK